MVLVLYGMAENKRKKILFFITKGSWGGAQSYVYDLASSLDSDEYDIKVVMGQGDILEKKLKEKGIKTRRLFQLERDVKIKKEFNNFFGIIKTLHEEDPDLIHLNSSKMGGLGSFAGFLVNIFFRKNIKIIFTAHGWATAEVRPLLQKTTIYFLTILTCLFSDKIITVSENDEKRTPLFTLFRKKIKTIRNGVGDFYLMDKDEAKKNILEIAKDKNNKFEFSTYNIYSLSELTKNKNIENTIDAIAKYNETHTEKISFVSTNQGELKDKINKKIIDLGIEKNAILLGYVDNAKQYLKAFDCLIIPSIKEGLPYAILEAGYAGIDVLSSDTGGTSEIVDNNINGILIKNTDITSIEEGIENIVRNKDKEFGKKLKNKIEDKFSLYTMQEETKKLYKEILNP